MPAISLFTLEDDDEEATVFPFVEVSLDGTLKNPSSYSAVDFSIFSSFLSVSKMQIIVLIRLFNLPFYTNKEKRGWFKPAFFFFFVLLFFAVFAAFKYLNPCVSLICQKPEICSRNS